MPTGRNLATQWFSALEPTPDERHCSKVPSVFDDLFRARKQYRWNDRSERFSAAVEPVQNPVFSSIAPQYVAAQIAEKRS
jgi:hypothetical protein